MTEAPPARTVLLVEDDPAYAAALAAAMPFAPGGPWHLEPVALFGQARERLNAGGIDAVLLDLTLPDAEGLEALTRLAAEFPFLPVLVLTARDDDALAIDAVRRGAQDYLVKGRVEEDLLGRALRHAIERKRTGDALRRLETAVGTMQLGVTITDAEGRIVYVNPAEAAMHGYTVEELLGRQARELSPREHWSPLTPERLSQVQRWKRERVRLRKDGSAFPVQLMSDVVTDEGGRPLGLITTCEDISERKRGEEALRQSEERYALAARGANDGLWDWSLATDCVYFSPRWKAILGYEDDEVGETPAEWLDRIHPEDVQKFRSKLTAHLEGRTPHFEIEHRLRHKDGTYRWVLSRGFSVRNAEGRTYRMAGALTDMTDRRAYDPLTGLPNRALFAERLTYAFARSRRRPDYLFAVIFLDVDRFKVINDSLGHMVGDQLLIAIAKRLEGCLRPGDAVARLAGDEFAVLLETIRDVGDATLVADRIQKEMSAPFRLGGQELFASASMGVALSSTGYERPEDLLRDADTAMYRAKFLGRARYEVFDGAMRQRVSARLAAEAHLRRAVDHGDFLLHYQPVVLLETGDVEGFEALVRWKHPEGRLATSGEFLPLAEETGLVLAIGAFALREACRQMREWQALSTAGGRLWVSVNLSGRQFAKPDLADEVEQALVATGLDGQSLRVEVRESVLLDRPQWARPALERLRGLGVLAQLDDFGTGHSSLSVLQHFPLTALKIDGQLVRALLDGPEEAGLIKTILSVARALEMDVVAKGVETEEQILALRELRCPRGQGVFFAAPLEGAAAAELIAGGARCAVPALRTRQSA